MHVRRVLALLHVALAVRDRDGALLHDLSQPLNDGGLRGGADGPALLDGPCGKAAI